MTTSRKSPGRKEALVTVSDFDTIERLALDGILPFQVRVEAYDPFEAPGVSPWYGFAQGSSVEYVREQVAEAHTGSARVRVVAVPSNNVLYHAVREAR